MIKMTFKYVRAKNIIKKVDETLLSLLRDPEKISFAIVEDALNRDILKYKDSEELLDYYKKGYLDGIRFCRRELKGGVGNFTKTREMMEFLEPNKKEK